MSGPRVLVLGGLGFIGKNLVKYIVSFGLAEKVRVVDKKIRETAYLNAELEEIFQNPIVECLQLDIGTKSGAEEAFAGDKFSIVVNLVTESDFGKDPLWYELKIEKARINAAKVAESHGVDKYIEVSTCGVYAAKGKGEEPCKEDHPIKPSDIVAEYHHKAEQQVLELCPTLPVVIARLPFVYGPGDVNGLMRRLVCAATYIDTDGECQFLYSDDLRIHTVHVQDAVGGIWFLCCMGVAREAYNIVDKNDTTQKKFNKILEEIFPISASCFGHLKTQGLLKTMSLQKIVDDANSNHGFAWADLIAEHGINSTPLTTFLHLEEMQGNPMSADGTKIEQLGYQYSVPTVTAEYVRHALHYWIDHPRPAFPNVLK